MYYVMVLVSFSLRDDDPSLEGNHKTTCLSLTDVEGSHDDINQTASRMDLCLTCRVKFAQNLKGCST